MSQLYVPAMKLLVQLSREAQQLIKQVTITSSRCFQRAASGSMFHYVHCACTLTPNKARGPVSPVENVLVLVLVLIRSWSLQTRAPPSLL